MKVQTNIETTQATTADVKSNDSNPVEAAAPAVKYYSDDDSYILETRMLWLRDDNDHSGVDLPEGVVMPHVGQTIPNRGSAESLEAAKAIALKSIQDSLMLVYATSGEPMPEHALLQGVVSFDAYSGAAIQIAWGNEACRNHELPPVTTKYTKVIPKDQLEDGDDKEPITNGHRTYQRLSRAPKECSTVGTTSEIILAAEAMIFSTNTYLPEYPGYDSTDFRAAPMKYVKCDPELSFGRNCFSLDFDGEYITVPFVFEF